MAEKSGFFNARYVNGEYDRKYSANDYSDNLAVIISSGVLRSTADDLKVTATGMLVTVGIGRAWIKGHYYNNTSAMTLAPVPAATGGSRYDRVVLRFDNNLQARHITIEYLQGIASNSPTRPALTRNDTVYELCLADIFVQSGASAVVATDTRSDSDVCGWVYSVAGDNSFFVSLDNTFTEWFDSVKDTLSSVTLLKRYQYQTTLQSATNTVTFSSSQYNADTCFVEVFVNGLYVTNYTVGTSTLTITFDQTLNAGTKVAVNVYRNIDGTGINSIVDDVADLQDAVAALDVDSRFTYQLTGTNDNIALSEIAQAMLDGEYDSSSISAAAVAFLNRFDSSFWESLNNDAKVTIYVEGQNLTATTPYEGSGTAASRYRWFSFGQIQSTDRKVIIDFDKCQNISIVPASDTSNIVFYGTDINVKNARVSVFTANANINIDMIASSYATGDINFTDCEFSVLTTGNVTLAQNGTFINCYARLRSSTGNCFCFCPKSAGLIQVIGGTFYTYIKASGKTAAVFYVPSTETDAVAMATNISCPTTTETGYSQQYLSSAVAGKVYIIGVISTQTTSGSNTEVVGQVWKSKH